MLCCDLVVASRSASFGDAHANYGLLPAGGGSIRLPRRVGPARAKHLMFTGVTVPAEDLAGTDLITALVGRRAADQRGGQPRRGHRRQEPGRDRGHEGTHRRRPSDLTREAGLRMERQRAAAHTGTHDFHEGLSAFAEKRATEVHRTVTTARGSETSMENLLRLDGKTVLVTGAGQGVGRQVALHCAGHGARVVVNDFHLDRADAVASEIRAAGGSAVASRCDVTDFDDVMDMVARAEQEAGGIDVLVNNAGNAGPVQDPMSPAPPFWETHPKEWGPWMGANFYGVLNCARAALPAMVERRSGRVVTVISDAGRVGEPGLPVYSGAKAGAAGFSRALAKAVGRYNITVNCVALASIRTPGVATATDHPDQVKSMLRSYVIRRLGEPSDAANLILFLASDAAAWVTGQTYPVNGGYSFAV